MTITYNHTAFPTQQIIYPPSASAQLIGLPIASARVFTYSSIDHAEAKTTYQSNSGNPPPALPNPVVANGIGQVTIYWELDDDQGVQDLYYVEILGPTGDDTVYYTYDNFDGASLIGDTTPPNQNVYNLVRNPQFTWNRFKQTYNLQYESSTVYEGTFVADDWFFTKNNNNAVETIAITAFAPGQSIVPNNPVNYLEWNLSSGATSETYKNVYQKYTSVQTFSGQTIAFQFWAASSSSTAVNIQFRQFFGTGGSPSINVLTTFSPAISLSPTWTLYTGTLTLPSVDGKTLGTDSNDCVQLEFTLALNAGGGTNFKVTNVQIETGSTVHSFIYETPDDQRNRLSVEWFGPPTGDIKFAAGGIADYPGWLLLNDLTIGSANSAATGYANEDGYALYDFLYTNFLDANCPVSGGRTGNSLNDFNNNKTIRMPLTMSRLLGNAGAGSGLTSRANGVTSGVETFTLTTTQLPAHTHTLNGTTAIGVGASVCGCSGADADFVTGAIGGVSFSSVTQSSGTGAAFNIMNPFSFIQMFIKL